MITILTSINTFRVLVSGLLFLISVPTYSQTKFAAPGEVAGAIRVNMLPFYRYAGAWQVAVKESQNKKDTIVSRGEATAIIRTDSIRFKRDSSEITFIFKWESDFIRDFMDMNDLSIRYSWDMEKYFVSITHEPRFGTWTGTACSPALDVDSRELLFNTQTNPKHPITFNRWKLLDERISMELKQRTTDNTIRHRIIIFQRD
jgi:hypothetical protein